MRYPIGIQDFENIRTHRDTVLRDYPQDALDQIDEKGYGWPFMADGRKVFKMAARHSRWARLSPRRTADWRIGFLQSDAVMRPKRRMGGVQPAIAKYQGAASWGGGGEVLAVCDCKADTGVRIPRD